MATEEASDPINIAEPPCNIAEQIPDPVPEQTLVEDQEPNPDSVPGPAEVDIAEQTLDTVSRGQNQPDITPLDQTVVPTSDEISAEPSVNEHCTNEVETWEKQGDSGGEEAEAAAGAVDEGENNPILKKLMLFLNDPFRKQLEFADNIASDDRYFVHKFVQEHGLTCESTGSNANHKFVISKADDDVDELDFESGDDGEEMIEGEGEKKIEGDGEEQMEGDGEEQIEGDGEEKMEEEEAGGDVSLSSQHDDVVELHSDLKEVETMQGVAKSGKKRKKKNKAPHQQKIKYNTNQVNELLTLTDLKLDNFSGCYKLSNHTNLLNALRSICQSAGIPFQIAISDIKDAPKNDLNLPTGFKASVFMNNIRVSDGYGRTHGLAKEAAVQNGTRYLQSKGLTLWNITNLQKRFIVEKNVEALGVDQKTFKKNFEAFVEEFIDDRNLVQLRVHGNFQQPAKSEWRRSTMIGVIHRYHLRKEISGKMIKASKVNSLIHKLNVYRTKEDFENGSPADHTQATTTSFPAEDLPPIKVVNELKPMRLRDLAESKLDREHGSLNLRGLEPIKMDNFQGVVTTRSIGAHLLPDLIIEFAQAVDVPFEFKVRGPYDGPKRLQWRTFLTINNIFIAKGFSKNASKSKSDCAKTAFFLLICKGLKVIFDNDICDEQIRKVDKAEVESASISELFKSFLEEKNHIKMKFTYRVSPSEKELFEALCETHSLIRTFDGVGEIAAVKKNSHLHKMELVLTEAEQKRATAILLSKEDLTVNASLRDHIQRFVNDKSLLELQFPPDLEVTQTELIEVLAEKHKLKHDKDGSGQVILSKDPNDPVHFAKAKTQPAISQGDKKLAAKQKKIKRKGLAGIPSSVVPKTQEQRGTKRPIMSGQGPAITKTFRTDNYSSNQPQASKPISHFKTRVNNWKNSRGKRTLSNQPVDSGFGRHRPDHSHLADGRTDYGRNVPVNHHHDDREMDYGRNRAVTNHHGDRQMDYERYRAVTHHHGDREMDCERNRGVTNHHVDREMDYGKNRAVTHHSADSWLDYGWVSDVVNRAVNTAVNVNSAVSVLSDVNSPPKKKSLLQPAYLSEDRGHSPSYRDRDSFESHQNTSGYHQSRDWQSANSSGTPNRRFASLGSQNRNIASPSAPATSRRAPLLSHAASSIGHKPPLMSGISQDNRTRGQSSGHLPFKPFEPYYKTPAASSEPMYHASRVDPYQGTDYGAQYSEWVEKRSPSGKGPVRKSNW